MICGFPQVYVLPMLVLLLNNDIIWSLAFAMCDYPLLWHMETRLIDVSLCIVFCEQW